MYYIYCRKSTESQNETSFEVQRDFLIRQAQLLNEPYEVHTETGSGSTMADRPVFMSVLSKLDSGDILGCYDQSRISRNSQESYIILDAIKQKKARLQVNGKFISPDDPQDMAIFGIQAVFSSYQRSIQLSKSKEGLKQKYSNGDAVFAGDTFGYELIRKNGHTEVSVVDEEAKVINYVFTQYAKGRSLYDIQNELYGKPFKRPFQITIQNLRPMIQRCLYMGKYLDSPGMQKHIARYTETEVREHLITSNIYPPIVTEELWWEVFHKYRSLRHPHAVNYNNRFTKNTLSGLFKCSGCGKGITFKNRRRNGKLFTQYIFQSHTPDCPLMKRTQFDAIWLENIIQACFLLTFLDGSQVGDFFNEVKERLHNETSEIQTELDEISDKIEKLDSQKNRLIDAVSNGLFSMEDVKNKMEEIRMEHLSLEKRKQCLESDMRYKISDADTYLEVSSQEVIDRYTENRREWYLKYIKEGINYHTHLDMEMMNGKKFEIYKPRRTNRATKPSVVIVYYRGEYEYSFTYEDGIIHMDKEYSRWEKMVNGELTMTDTIMI